MEDHGGENVLIYFFLKGYHIFSQDLLCNLQTI